jgi:hypothetical protein
VPGPVLPALDELAGVAVELAAAVIVARAVLADGLAALGELAGVRCGRSGWCCGGA